MAVLRSCKESITMGITPPSLYDNHLITTILELQKRKLYLLQFSVLHLLRLLEPHSSTARQDHEDQATGRSFPSAVQITKDDDLKLQLHRRIEDNKADVLDGPVKAQISTGYTCPGSYPGPPQGRTCLKHLKGRRPGITLARCLSHYNWLLSTNHLITSYLDCRYPSAASGSHRPKRPTLQPDSIAHRRCPPMGSRVTTVTDTHNLAATAPLSCLDIEGTEHGSLTLNVLHLSRNMLKVLPERGVKAPSHTRLCQTFPADPHKTFGPAKSDRHPPPTHH
ncbi:hypothetical protein CCH79_00013830 [Gambusia affinis]|uniref:Uncharacterized protein n=1 Tax=Gambusia affinis TaxID=33528 RepID=A0A315VWJ0_GAMAF|nr:hypothetical protein CCH79_00013830 [Gambusia affinis]